MTAFYNDIDPFCCRVLEKNIRAGHLPAGVVDGRDIRDVRPEDLAGFDQVHLFAGVGGFALGLRRAGVPDDFPIWTGGDPCQGNSNAGSVWKRPVEDVAVHFLRLAGAVRPPRILRENPTSGRADAPWPWHRFRSGLESLGYAVLPFRLRACCLGADHEGDRLFLLAGRGEADGQRLEGLDRKGLAAGDVRRASGDRARRRPADGLPASRVCREGDGLPDRVDRTRAIGNSVDPRMVEQIGRWLLEASAGGAFRCG